MVGILEDNFIMEKYSIKLINNLKVTSFLWQTTLIICAAGYFLSFNKETFFIIFIFYAIFAIPALYLHIEYLIRNNGQTIQIEKDKLILTQGSKTVSYKFTNMDKIILYKSASLDKGGIPLSPIEPYHYARVITKSNEELVITCLLVPKVDEIVTLLKGVKYERIKRPFCTTFWK